MIAKFKDNSYRWSPPAVILIAVLACIALPEASRTKAAVTDSTKPAAAEGPSGDTQQRSPVIRELKIDIGWNTSLSLSRDGSKLVFCRRKNGKENLVVHNIVSGQETEITNHMTGHAWKPVFSPDGSKIAYTLWGSDARPLHIVTLQTGEDRPVGHTGFALDWSRNGRFILVGDGSTAGILSIDAEAVQKTDFSLPGESGDQRFSPNGECVSYSNNGNLYLHPMQGGDDIQLTRNSHGDSQPLWSPDGRMILFLSRRAFGEERDLCVVPIRDGKSGGDVRIVKADFGDDLQLYSLSETGRLLYKQSLEDRNIFSTEINPNTGQPVGEPVRLCSGSHPVWSPDGRQIAYIAKGTLRVMSADGKNDHEIMKTAFHESGTYAWAPDNDTIYVQERGKSGFGISAISVSRKERRYVLPEDTQVNCIHLTASPDGKWLAFLKPAPPSRKNQIFIVGVDGANPRQLTSYEDGYINYPAWSPNGNEIAFEYGPGNGIKTLMIICVGDGTTRTLIQGISPEDDRFFWKSWSPDGSKIAWSTWDDTRIGQVADGEYEPFKVNVEGPSGTYEPQGPSWSPDGERMLFFTYVNVWQVMIMENFLPAAVARASR